VTDPSKTVLTKEAAAAALPPIIEATLQWYWDETNKWEPRAWQLQTGVMILSSLVTVFAALPPAVDAYQPWMKWGVVLISAMVTLLSSLLSKSGIARTAEIREQGRIKLVTLKQRAILRLTMRPMTDEERLAYFERLIDAVEDIEQLYGIHPVVAGKRHPSRADT
jgi:hypothetical protein